MVEAVEFARNGNDAGVAGARIKASTVILMFQHLHVIDHSMPRSGVIRTPRDHPARLYSTDEVGVMLIWSTWVLKLMADVGTRSSLPRGSNW